jgi:aconitate hydratase
MDHVPVHLVIEHSVNVFRIGSPTTLRENMEIERRQNAERFEFFDWGRRAFANVEIVPLGQGILHQINLERFSPVSRLTLCSRSPRSFVTTAWSP